MVRVPRPRKDDNRLEVEQHRGIYTSLGYRSVTVAAKEGRAYPAGSGDYFLDYDRGDLIRQSRNFYRNNAIYRGLIDTAVRYVVGRGFGLRVLGKNTRRNEALEAVWARWYRNAEVRGLVSRRRLAAMVCREAMLAGDVGQIKRRDRTVQVVESEQISKGTVPDKGIELDDDGRPHKYYVCPYGRNGQLSRSGRQEYQAADFIFLTAPGRPSQTRGEPALQASFPMQHRINDVCDSEAVAWQRLSRLSFSVTRDQGPELGHAESIADPNKPNAASEGDVAARLVELDYALIYHGRPGDKVEGIERNIPGTNFTESLRTFLRLLGLPLGMPLELILLDWSQANYSQSRAVLEQAYQTFCDWQDALEDYHYQPLFDWQLPQLLQEAGYKDRNGIETEWIRPTFPWIDQLKEAQAHGIKIDRCLTTHAHVLKELNQDRENIVAACELEVRDAIARSQAIKEDTGVDVPWEIFCGRQAPKAATAGGLKKATDDDENTGTDKERDDD